MVCDNGNSMTIMMAMVPWKEENGAKGKKKWYFILLCFAFAGNTGWVI